MFCELAYLKILEKLQVRKITIVLLLKLKLFRMIYLILCSNI